MATWYEIYTNNDVETADYPFTLNSNAEAEAKMKAFVNEGEWGPFQPVMLQLDNYGKRDTRMFLLDLMPLPNTNTRRLFEYGAEGRLRTVGEQASWKDDDGIRRRSYTFHPPKLYRAQSEAVPKKTKVELKRVKVAKDGPNIMHAQEGPSESQVRVTYSSLSQYAKVEKDGLLWNSQQIQVTPPDHVHIVRHGFGGEYAGMVMRVIAKGGDNHFTIHYLKCTPSTGSKFNVELAEGKVLKNWQPKRHKAKMLAFLKLDVPEE